MLVLALAAPAAAWAQAARPPARRPPARTPARPAPRTTVRVHEVLLREVTPRETYRYDPAEVVARPGDRLRFRVASGRTHSIVFRGEGMSAPVRAAWNAALVDRVGELTSPLLVLGDRPYEIVVPAVPPGRYEFFCLPKLAYNMIGAVRVVAR